MRALSAKIQTDPLPTRMQDGDVAGNESWPKIIRANFIVLGHLMARVGAQFDVR